MKKSCLHNTKCNQYQWLLDKITIWTSLKFNSNQMPMIQIWISLKLNRSRKYSKQEHELSFMDDILTRVRSNYLNADPQKFTQWVDDLMDLRDSVTPLWNWLSWHQLLHTHNTRHYTRNSAPSTSLYKLPTFINLSLVYLYRGIYLSYKVTRAYIPKCSTHDPKC